MNDDTFNFFLSPHIDKDYFTSNKPTNFKNFKPQEINLYNNLVAVIRVKQIYIKGILYYHNKSYTKYKYKSILLLYKYKSILLLF